MAPVAVRDTLRRAPAAGAGCPAASRRCLLPFLLAALVPALAAASPPADPDPAALERLRARIAALSRELAATRGAHAEAVRALRESEKAIGRVERELEAVEARLRASRRALERLRAERAALRERLARQRTALARTLRAAYLVGREERLKLLLSQEDPAALGRVLAYHRYLVRARLERIEAVRASLAALRALETRIADERERQETLHAARERERERLAARRAERAAAVARLAARLRRGEDELRRLERDRAALERLLNEVERALEGLPRPEQARPFAELRGRLPWPARGRLLARFGARRAAGGLRWRGVLIGAREGTPVRAVSHGRVVFADWLRGLGLLLIIDHGDGWMTLYGHNRSLYKEVGDWVQAGEVIASVGDSGGRERAALYFEIRHRGRPIDPVRWCRGSPVARGRRSG